MKNGRWILGLTLVGMATVMCGPRTAFALDFDTLIFADDFEGFTVGQTISAGVNDAPSTGIGLIWQYIGTGGQEAEVSDAQAFGSGTKSLDIVRPFLGIVPRYFTYPALVPESTITANTSYGIQFDVYLPENEFAVGAGAPHEGLSGINIGIAPDGGPIVAGQIVSYGDAEVRVWDTAAGGFQFSGGFFGLGWQTLEITHEVGADVGGSADDLITFFLTRHAGNVAGELPRTQIYQVTESLPLGGNFRLDINNTSQGRFYLDNVQVGTLGSGAAPGDFDGDGDVDGNDFLVWQRGESPNPVTAGDLDLWKTNFGFGGGAVPAVGAVPEPATTVLCTIAVGMLWSRRRRRGLSC